MRLAHNVVAVLFLPLSTVIGDFVAIHCHDITPKQYLSISHAFVTSRKAGMFIAFPVITPVIASARENLASIMSD